MSYTVISEYPCYPGKGKEFLKLLLIELADTRAYAGCELLETYVDQDNSDLIVFGKNGMSAPIGSPIWLVVLKLACLTLWVYYF